MAAILLLFLLSCDYQHGLHPVNITGISGTITFNGQWPTNTDWIRIICFTKKPRSEAITDILLALFEAKISDPLPLNVSSYPYTLELDPGTYEWVVVVFNSRSAPFKVIGEYEGPNLVVGDQQLLTDINITADFNRLRNR